MNVSLKFNGCLLAPIQKERNKKIGIRPAVWDEERATPSMSRLGNYISVHVTPNSCKHKLRNHFWILKFNDVINFTAEGKQKPGNGFTLSDMMR